MVDKIKKAVSINQYPNAIGTFIFVATIIIGAVSLLFNVLVAKPLENEKKIMEIREILAKQQECIRNIENNMGEFKAGQKEMNDDIKKLLERK